MFVCWQVDDQRRQQLAAALHAAEDLGGARLKALEAAAKALEAAQVEARGVREELGRAEARAAALAIEVREYLP